MTKKVTVWLLLALSLSGIWLAVRIPQKENGSSQESSASSFRKTDEGQMIFDRGKTATDLSLDELRDIAAALAETLRELDPKAAVIFDAKTGTIKNAREPKSKKFIISDGETVVAKISEAENGTFTLSTVTATMGPEGILAGVKIHEIDLAGNSAVRLERKVQVGPKDHYNTSVVYNDFEGNKVSRSVNMSAKPLGDGMFEIIVRQ